MPGTTSRTTDRRAVFAFRVLGLFMDGVGWSPPLGFLSRKTGRSAVSVQALDARYYTRGD